MRKIHIYGDNILECEESLRTIERAFDLPSKLIASPLYAPIYVISLPDQIDLKVQLLPGYGRWSYDVQKQMKFLGAVLREAPDAIITEVIHNQETPLIAFEFSGALPAGNNAWQRCGRALGCAQASVPYIYIAELGGIELGKDRGEKAARVPNPIIPFAYFTLSTTFGSPSIVFYLPSPTINQDHHGVYSEAFGSDELSLIVRDAILLSDIQNSDAFNSLKSKAVSATQKLAQARKNTKNSLKSDEWEILSRLATGSEKALWFINRKMTWKKKVSIATTKSFKAFQKVLEKWSVGIGSVDLPFAIVSTENRKNLAVDAMRIYGGKLSAKFSSWLRNSNKPLVIVLIAGFKPRGDDSRPDRGLAPLVRMIFGNDVDVLPIVYGPGKKQMWKQLNQDMWGLASRNGLWEAIVNLSDAILIDSRTYTLPNLGLVVSPAPEQVQEEEQVPIEGNVKPLKFGEHDIDSVLHTIFSAMDQDFVYECLCNPPGGNWSGISLFDSVNSTELRWSSLPRVSGKNSKRPDHIFQINLGKKPETLLIIESKEQANKVEDNIGQRLIRYVSDLISIAPNISRLKDEKWSARKVEYLKSNFDFVSCAAFEFGNQEGLNSVHARARVDITIGIEFTDSGKVIVHLIAKKKFDWLDAIFKNAKKVFGEQIDMMWH